MKTIFKRSECPCRYELLASDCFFYGDFLNLRQKKVDLLIDHVLAQNNCSAINQTEAKDCIVLWKWNRRGRRFSSSNKTELSLTKKNYKQLCNKADLIVKLKPAFIIVLQSQGYNPTYEIYSAHCLCPDDLRMIKSYGQCMVIEFLFLIFFFVAMFWLKNKIKSIFKSE